MIEKTTKQLLTSPFALIDAAWQTYTKNVPFYMKIVLPPTLFYLFLDTLSYTAKHGSSTNPFVAFAQLLQQYVLLSVLFYALAFVVQLFSTAALLTALFAKKQTSVSEMYDQGKQYFFPYLGLSLLSACISGGGFLLLIIPGIILSVWFTFAQYILFNEHKKWMTALLTSREYVRGYFWQVLGRIIFISLIVAALSSIAGYISLIFQNELVVTVAQSLVTLITIPLAMIYQALVYENIKSLKGEISIKTKARWLYVVGSLVPFMMIISLITLLMYVKPLKVTDTASLPAYKQGSYLLLATLPRDILQSSSTVVYQKNNQALIRSVMAGPGETIQRKKDQLIISPADSSAVHHGTYTISSLTPAFQLQDGAKRTLGKTNYLIFSVPLEKQTPNWEEITQKDIIGVPLFCFWNCALPKEEK